MRRQIHQTIDAGHFPEKVVLVTGAYHASVLNTDYPAMTDEELVNLYRVSRASWLLCSIRFIVYPQEAAMAAGNKAPQYFQLLWKRLVKGDISRLPVEFLARLARYLRNNGTPRSAAEVIEGMSLANTLAQG